MTAPTPDEITAALELLHRVPGVDGGHSLDAVAEIASPIVQMARELREWLKISRHTPDLGQLASQLESIAPRHGLRITTDPAPGELVGYYAVAPADEQMHVKWIARHLSPGTLADAAEAARDRFDSRVAAMHLLPEGQQ